MNDHAFPVRLYLLMRLTVCVFRLRKKTNPR
jgi:hypothetical protein